MKNRLVNYGETENGVAIIELISDSAGEPLEGDKTPVNTYTREMWHDIDDAILEARFNDDIAVIIITGHGEKFFSAGASIKYLNTCLRDTSTSSACTPTRLCPVWSRLPSWS